MNELRANSVGSVAVVYDRRMKAAEDRRALRGISRVVPGLIFLLGLFLGLAVRAAEVIPPAPDRYFNDYAHVTSPDVAEQINAELEGFEKQTSSQIASPNLPCVFISRPGAVCAIHSVSSSKYFLTRSSPAHFAIGFIPADAERTVT